MNLRWFVSRTARQAGDLRKQVRFIFQSQRDLLAPRAATEITRALEAFATVYDVGTADQPTLQRAADKLEQAANQWLQPYPSPAARENFKEFLVSAVLVLTIFNFFCQPMKIPSGSAQPTLYGNVVTDLKEDPGAVVPGGWGRVLAWFQGIDYHLWVAPVAGRLHIDEPPPLLGFIKRTRFTLGDSTYNVWFPPERLMDLAGAHEEQEFRQGDTVLKLRISSGDRLFVDRFTYNFRRPERGEVIVFVTAGITPYLRPHPGPDLIPDTHYIKRLIALAGDHVRIGNDRHVVIAVARNRHDGTLEVCDRADEQW